MALGDGHSVSFLILWPNVRPWRFFDAQPMLRCVPNVDQAADILADALRKATTEDEAARTDSDTQGARRGGQTAQLGTAPATGR
jgi:hypothetical protein